MTVQLPSATRPLSIELAEDSRVQVLSPNNVVRPDDEVDLIETALDSPIGTDTIEDIISRSRNGSRSPKVCLIVEDITRSGPTKIVSETVVRRILGAGIPSKDIYVVFALGTHRKMTRAEMQKKVGSSLLAEIPAYNSAFDDPENLVFVTEENGVPLLVDRRVADADIRVSIGTVVPHPVGFSGGAKMIVPGVTGRKTVSRFHLELGMQQQNEFGQGITRARELIEKWVELIGLDFCINCVITPDKKLYRVRAGHFIDAQRRAVADCIEVYGVRARARTDLVIANSYPAEIDFWQAQKAFNSGQLLVVPGGEVVLVSPCGEGIGPHSELPAFYRQAREDSATLYRQCIEGKVADVIGASSGLSKAIAIFRNCRAGIVSDGVTAEECRDLGITKYESIADLLEQTFRVKPNATVSVITHAGYLFPFTE